MNRLDITVKEREQLYRLVISQLFYDGHQNLAVGLANQVKTHAGCPPSDRLAKIVALGLKVEAEQQNSKVDKANNFLIPGNGIDLEYETDVQVSSPETALYETVYVTAHKAACRAAVFSKNGQLIATGSEDTSIKVFSISLRPKEIMKAEHLYYPILMETSILDVDRMLAKSSLPPDLHGDASQQQMENHPVVRTLYDHTAEVTCLEFHPYIQMLISGGKDCTLKFFEFSKSSVKKAFKSITEAAEIRCISVHPTGDYLLVGTQHPTLRLYDINTGQCFVSGNPVDQHKGPITAVKYCPNANLFVTSSKDGDIKIWDGVSNKCINTFTHAHEGAEVCSVAFSKNSKYVLSSGKDSLVKLWELSTARCLIAYTGAGTTGKQEHRSQAIFNHTEDYVLFPDEKTGSLCCWDSRNADRQRLLALGHNSLVRCIVHSPSIAAFLSCSDDCRARFWYRKSEIE